MASSQVMEGFFIFYSCCTCVNTVFRINKNCTYIFDMLLKSPKRLTQYYLSDEEKKCLFQLKNKTATDSNGISAEALKK